MLLFHLSCPYWNTKCAATLWTICKYFTVKAGRPVKIPVVDMREKSCLHVVYGIRHDSDIFYTVKCKPIWMRRIWTCSEKDTDHDTNVSFNLCWRNSWRDDFCVDIFLHLWTTRLVKITWNTWNKLQITCQNKEGIPLLFEQSWDTLLFNS